MFSKLHTNVEYYRRVRKESSDRELRVLLHALRIHRRQTIEICRYFRALKLALDRQVAYQQQMKNALKNLQV